MAPELSLKSDLCAPRNETARPPSRFLHSWICKRLIYSHDRSAYACYCLGSMVTPEKREKGPCHKTFDFLIFLWISFPPNTWVYHYGHFKFFRKFAEIFLALGAPTVSTTLVANGKKLKKFNNFVLTPLCSRVNTYNFCLQVHFKVSGVWYCSH